MLRCHKYLRALSTGGITLGILQAFDMVDFATVFTNFLATIFSLLVALLLGGAPPA